MRRRRANEASSSQVLRPFMRSYALCLRVRRRNKGPRWGRANNGRVFRICTFCTRPSDNCATSRMTRRKPITRNNVLRIIRFRACTHRCVSGRNTKVRCRWRGVRWRARASNARFRCVRLVMEVTLNELSVRGCTTDGSNTSYNPLCN